MFQRVKNMFSKLTVVPVMQRSRFAKAKPKIFPKSSQSINEKDLSKSSGEEKGSEPLSPVANKNASQDTSSTSESVSLNQQEKSRSCKSVDEVSPSRSNLNKVSTDGREQKKPSATKKEHENLDKNSSLQDESENQIYNVNQGSQLPVTSTTPLSVACTETSPVKNSSLKELNKHTEDENSYFLPNYERPKTFELVEKVIPHPSPIKTSVVSSTDKSLKYPYLTKILAAPKKRPHNKKMNERKKKMASYKELPPRNEMTFTDLIYWNPNTAPMKKKEKSLTVFDLIKKQTSAKEELDEDDDTFIAPKLFVNENGEILLDESSLVIERKETFVDMNAEAVIIDDSNITYATFRRKVSKKWSPKETVIFYKALSVIGTDFALMESIIPNRTRRELKMKFKKEEKINMKLLHRAMYETDTFQSELSVEGLDLEVIDIPGLEESVADNADASNGKKHRKGKSQVLSEIANSQPLKKGRGRPKRKKNACNTSHAENSSPLIEPDNAIIEDDETSIMRKKKTGILPQSSQEGLVFHLKEKYCSSTFDGT